MPRTLELAPTTERRLLLAASTGGHLAQLVRLAPGLGASDESLWVTFDSLQEKSLLAGRNVLHVPYVGPRDYVALYAAWRRISAELKGQRIDAAVSTGSALALAALPAARLAGMPALYIESVSRVDGPSLSGRVLAMSRLAEMRTQHATWSNGRWKVHPSVLNDYVSGRRTVDTRRPLKIFITLGTIKGFAFDALVDRILDLGIANEDTVWQLGSTPPRRDLPGTVRSFVDAAEFEAYARDADVVITHAGVGTILGLIDLGIYPLAVVRRKRRGEHVDDHQQQIAGMLNDLDIGRGAEVEDLDRGVIESAARRWTSVHDQTVTAERSDASRTSGERA